jgi:hypothetical protein
LLAQERAQQPPPEPSPPKRAYRHNLSPEQRSEIARKRAIRRIPTSSPGRDPWQEYTERAEEHRKQLAAKLEAIREDHNSPKKVGGNWYSWWAWLSFCDELKKRLNEFDRHPNGQPISCVAIEKLRDALSAMEDDLKDTKPC